MKNVCVALALSVAGLLAFDCPVAVAGSKAAKKESDKMISKSEKFLGCTEMDGNVNGEQSNVIQYRCDSQVGPPMWMRIQEAVRYSFGFGQSQNLPQSAVGDAEGDIEWWGTLQKGKFAPRAVIKRVEFSDFGEPEKHTDQLVVFRLLKNGKSCVIAIIASSQSENAEARKIAVGDGKCQG